MAEGKMHADEVETDAGLVGRLVGAQFPEWAELRIEAVRSAGTDHAIYRLGAEMAVRLPRREGAVGQVEKEQRWLPELAPQLPLAIPIPLGRGEPGEGYPWDWSVYPWFDGEEATLERLDDPAEAALVLAGFISALGRIDPSGGPAPGSHNFHRGVALARRGAATRTALGELAGEIDTESAGAAWEASLRAAAWDGPGVWIHGDLQSGNLLVMEGRLSAVIDFGGLGVGDPACDLMVAWSLFPAETRGVFREAVGVDEATWLRGRGWALSAALIGLPYYMDTNAEFVRNARHVVGQVLADHERGS